MSAKEADTDQAQSRESGLAGVGATLASTRKKQQLNIESVAANLHLSAEIVAALEAGDEARLPATAFVRGYVKSYARLLGLDQAALVAQLPEIDELRPATLTRVGVRRRGVAPAFGKWVVWGFALAAVGSVIIYGVPALERMWSERPAEPEPDQLQLPQSPPEAAVEPALLPVPDQRPLASSEEAIAEVAAPEAQLDAGAQVGDRPATEPEPEPVAEEVAETQETKQEPVGPAVISMRFLEDSWVEMEAHGRKLVVGTQQAGSERTVRAEPPIQVLLGNAPGVELSYRGAPVDLTPHRRGKVARLTLED